ncbi:hypothetical protein FQN57_001785 [Myotisia sp. PD_48]|nr:hypothetical protein FQN57_001785 [Myotisia sp. PD_48]
MAVQISNMINIPRNISFSALLPFAITAIFFYLGGLCVYRLFFHPLAKFPGPKLAAVTRYYEAYYDIIQNGQYTFKIKELHEKYGPIIRISPFELHINDSDFHKQLYQQDGIWNKYEWSMNAFLAKGSTICTVEHEVHKRRRAPLNPFLSKVSVTRKQDVIQSHVDKFCSRMGDHVGSTISFGCAISAFTRDVANDFLLGKKFNNLDRQDFNAGLTTMFQRSGYVWRTTKHIPWFGLFLRSLPLSVIEKMGENGAKEFLRFVMENMQLVRDITADPGPDAQSTIIHAILNSNLPPEEKSLDRLDLEVGTITGAAFETSAQTLRCIFYHVYAHAEILGRVRAELATVKSQELSQLQQLPYLTAVITEGLRLSPGLATRLARIAPHRDLLYNSWVIPKGTPVGMTNFLLHRDEGVYPNPTQFDPQRWLNTDGPKKNDRTFAPFSKGTRHCLGLHLAWAEMYMVLAAIVQRFDLDFTGVQPEDFEPTSDQFIIGTQSDIKAKLSLIDQ